MNEGAEVTKMLVDHTLNEMPKKRKIKQSMTNLPPKPQPKPKPGTVKVVRALYKYEARYEDELSFEEGDILYIFDRSNPEWWKARCGSKSGLVPSNYVEGKIDEIINPLHEASRRGNLSFLQECLNQGVSPTRLDSMGNTALYWASHCGHIDCIKYLLNQPNPPVNAQNHFGDTPLHGAAAKNHFEAIEMLLKAGADSTILNNNGETAEMLTINFSIKNMLQKHRLSKTIVNITTPKPEDYEDDSD